MIKEIVIYKIKPDQAPGFSIARSALAEELAELPGFHSITTEVSTDDEHMFIDIALWRTADDAKRAFEGFPKLKSAPALMAALEGDPVFAGHFEANA
ncbi:MAG: antibiotic biosynthesis monooxygenase family protein [Nannocystales bacterium]